MMETNVLHKMDCLNLSDVVDQGSVDLIYLDPPFFSQKDYGDFTDKWKDLDHYLDYMTSRLSVLYDLLKPTGSIYLHCDQSASHYLKVAMDGIFGRHNFQNNIVWTYTGGRAPSKGFAKKHDDIMFYSKTNDFTFNRVGEPYAPATIKRFDKEDEYGKYKLTKKGDKTYKTYLQSDGKPVPDHWNISIVMKNSSEKVNYNTQKPLALLERIIKASSNEGDMVLDPFYGSGTTLYASKMLGRNYIGADLSDKAYNTAMKRMATLAQTHRLF